MRGATVLRSLWLLAVFAVPTGCATTGSGDRGAPGDSSPASRGRIDPTAPTRELDLIPRAIPSLLTDALRYPYTPPAPRDCTTIAAQVRELDLALGVDLDNPARPPAKDHTAGRLLISGIKSALPYFGWLRRLSGADRRQRLAQAAFTAGHARRGYLKGVGQQLGCVPPAAPSVPVEQEPFALPAQHSAGHPG